MAGGIQPGTTAFDVSSKKLDDNIKNARDTLSTLFSYFTMVKCFTKQDKLDFVGDDCFGFAPDGGAWFLNGKLVAVMEGKKQGTKGNACERWWDNAVTAKHINPDVVYITFCTGEGAAEGEVLDKLRRKARIMMGDKYRFYMSPEGFSLEQIVEVMRNALQEIQTTSDSATN